MNVICERIARGLASAALLAALGTPAGQACAQIVNEFDPSARSAGMGGASAAVSWGGPVNPWANPALAAAVPGVTARLVDLRLLPGFTDVQARYQSTALTASVAGLGLFVDGRPFGGSELEVSGFLPLDERVDDLGFAVSGAGVADALSALTGASGRVSEWGDVAWGRTWKRYRTLDGSLQDASRDEGWSARVTPIGGRRGDPGLGPGLRIDLSAAYSRSEAPLHDWTDHRTSFATHFTWSDTYREGGPVAPVADAFRGGFARALDVTLAFDHERFESGLAGGSIFASTYSPYEVEHLGSEFVLMGVLSGRLGYVSDPDHGIRKPAWGAGVRVPLGRSGDLRYDLASSPQAYPRRLWRNEITLRMDPIARWFGSRSSSRR